MAFSFKSSCHVLSQEKISAFSVCCQSPLLEMSKYHFQCFFFFGGGGEVFDSHGMTFLQRETNLHGHEKRALKTSPNSCEPESEEKAESENLENTSRFVKCHGEPYGALITCVSCCKA